MTYETAKKIYEDLIAHFEVLAGIRELTIEEKQAIKIMNDHIVDEDDEEYLPFC